MDDSEHIEIYSDKKEEALPFEEYKHENGVPYWLASELLSLLGYDNINNFREPIEKAKEALKSNRIPIEEDIMPYLNDKGETDYKLSRFACYIIVMNSDPKKEEVARAQVYFAEQTRKFEIMVQTNKDFERLKERNQFSYNTIKLSSIISEAGILDYKNFHNAGYKGLYNMYNFELAKKRNLPVKSLLDHMGDVELAAKSLQAVLTGEKIKKEQITGQQNTENAHEKIGKGVRELIKDSIGMNPEDLPAETAIIKIKKDLKSVQKEMIKQDKKKSKRERSKGKS